MKYFSFLLFAFFIHGCAHQNIKSQSASHDLSKHSILLVLAHPDDETIIGSFLLYLREQNIPVHAIYATNGSGGKHFSNPKISGDELGAVRESELDQAARCYGFRTKILAGLKDVPFRDARGLPSRDGQTFLNTGTWNEEQLRKIIEDAVSTFKSDIIITMSLDKNTHAHHKAVRLITQKLLDEKKLSGVAYAMGIKERRPEAESIHDEQLHSWIELPTTRLLNTGDSTFAEKSYECAKFHQSQKVGHLGPLWGEEKLSMFYSADTAASELLSLKIYRSNK